MRPGTRILAATLFTLLLGEALLLSPPARPDQWAWLWRLCTGDWAGEEPLVVALFNLMGVWPAAMAVLLAPHLRRDPVPLWPFALASFALGAFVLAPGLAIGGEAAEVRPWQRWLGSRIAAGVLLVPALGLFGWGLMTGSADAFAAQWQAEQFVHVMALDFLVLWGLSIALAREDGGPWPWALLPVVGALLYRIQKPVA